MENPFEILINKLENIENLLHQILKNQSGSRDSDNQDVFMNVSQVAEYLNLTIPTIYSLCSKAQIPNYKKGKRLYFKKKDLDEWITESKRMTNSEIERKTDDYLNRRRKNRM